MGWSGRAVVPGPGQRFGFGEKLLEVIAREGARGEERENGELNGHRTTMSSVTYDVKNSDKQVALYRSYRDFCNTKVGKGHGRG